MAIEPTVLPRFATNDLNNGTGGAPNVVEPTTGKKDTGWNEGERPPRETFNWLHRITHDWIAWFQQEVHLQVQGVKTANQEKTDDATFADDADIEVTLTGAIGDKFEVTGYINWSGANANNQGIRLRLQESVGTLTAEFTRVPITIQSNSSGDVEQRFNLGPTGGTIIILDTVTDTFGANGQIAGVCRLGATTVTLALQWAQNISHADGITLKEGSYLKFTKL